MLHIANLIKNTDTSNVLSHEQFIAQIDKISRDAQISLAVDRQKNRQRRIDGIASRSSIPARYLSAALEPCSKSQADAYLLVRNYADHFHDALKSGSGLLLTGDVGTGKTHLACALANALMADMRSVMYCTAMESVLLIKRSWGFSPGNTCEFDVYERFAESDLLIIDEIGVQKGSEFERTVLTAIIDSRSRKCLPTVAISNLYANDIFDLLGERAFDRLVGFGSQIVEMRGPSLRQLNLVNAR